MYLAIIILPLLGSIVSGFFGRKVGVVGAQILATGCVILTTLLAIISFSEVAFNNILVQISAFRWLDLESVNVFWGFNFDSLTVSMLIPVLIISSLVHVYSVGYMSHDPHNQRFFSYLSLFTFMMIILVSANNFLLMFVGWEGVGVCSYLLVSFWFTRIAANQSSISAFLTNRVGDCFLTLGMIVILLTFGNLDYSSVFSLVPYISENNITVIGICLLIGAMAKSSQIGLHVWLPLAMEGPTPVSALIHAATMVTAGVYLLMRASPLIEYSNTVLITCLWVGSVTTVFSSLVGLFQQDIKKVIAYSTMSQLGMMVIAIGLSSYNLALFHLVNHAFYKGLLFLGAGAVIHAISDNQDFRRYGGFILLLPLSYTVMLIASLSLVAFPYMTGFYSKDFILESCFGQFNYASIAVYFTALVAAIFTTLYSVKVLYLTFLTGANASWSRYRKAHEGDFFMSLPLVVLSVLSIFLGFITKDTFIGIGSGLFIDNSLFIHPLHEATLNAEFSLPAIIKLLPFIITSCAIIISLLLLELVPSILLYLKFSRLGYNIFSLLNLKFLIDVVYNRFVAYLILKLGGQTTKVLDKGLVEKLGPYGLEKGLTTLSRNLATLDTGVVTTYALYILIGFMFYISIPFLSPKDQDLLFVILSCAFLFVIVNNMHVNKQLASEENRLKIVKSSSSTGLIIFLGFILSCQVFSKVSNSGSSATSCSADIDPVVSNISSQLPETTVSSGNDTLLVAEISTGEAQLDKISSNLAKNCLDYVNTDHVTHYMTSLASAARYAFDTTAYGLKTTNNVIKQQINVVDQFIVNIEWNAQNIAILSTVVLASAAAIYWGPALYNAYTISNIRPTKEWFDEQVRAAAGSRDKIIDKNPHLNEGHFEHWENGNREVFGLDAKAWILNYWPHTNDPSGSCDFTRLRNKFDPLNVNDNDLSISVTRQIFTKVFRDMWGRVDKLIYERHYLQLWENGRPVACEEKVEQVVWCGDIYDFISPIVRFLYQYDINEFLNNYYLDQICTIEPNMLPVIMPLLNTVV